ncbi:unnamed protein product [Bathycoccus prasinos]
MGVCLLDLAHATFPYFGGYEPLTDVTEHSKIDLDLIDIIGNIGGTCGAPCLLSATCPATSVAAEGTGCNYEGSILAFPSGDHCKFSPDEPKNELLSGITCDESSNAYDIWLNGQHSDKGVKKGIRKISGFASGAAAKSSGHGVDYKDNKYITIMNKYWKSKGLDEHTWGYDMIKAAFDGTIVTGNSDLNFGTVGRDFRKEAIQKGIVYLNVFPYVIWEMQDQVNDCNAGTLTNNDDDSVHAWDEAVAFYAGSTVGGSYGTSDTGKLQFALADKRCVNFKTCTNGFSGGSQVNADILALFNAGKEAARTGVASNGDCDTLDTLMDKISALSLVPFVQGVMRYLYKTKSVASAKEAGELWAFATAVLPFVNEVDSVAAEKLYQRAWAGDFSANSYEDIKSGVESTLTRLGAGDGVGLVTCSMVGDLYDGTVLSNVGCPVSGTQKFDFGGYEALTDVTEHSEIDLDLINIMANLGGTCGSSCTLKDCDPSTSVAAEGTGCNYDGSTMAFPSGTTCQWGEDKTLDGGSTCTATSNAYDIWLEGQNSAKSSAMRKISGFASGAAAKSSGHGVDYKDNKYITIMNKYWKSKGLDEHTWGYDMIKAAFDGTIVTGNSDLNFGTVGRDFRKEAIQKGIVYLNVFPYVIWEMQDQVNDCNAGTLTNNDDASVHAWDEAVAFYAGSTVGESYGTSTTGKLQFALADKRCENFKTCANGFSGGSQVNADILALFNAGKEAARTGVAANGDCDTLDTLMDKISALSLVPFVQGVMRYLYKTKSVASAKEAGELWAFATAVLPFVNEVDSVAAEKLYQRAWTGDFSANSYEDIKSGVESTLTRLGAGDGVGLVTCSMVGDLYDGTVLSNVGCSDSNSDSKKDKEIELGVGLGLGLPLCASLVAVVFLSVARHRNQRKFDELLAKQTTLRDNYNKV